MSSTYVYDRAFLELRGRETTYVVAFIKSVSSNVFPRTPLWSAYFFSKLEDAMILPLRHSHYFDEGLSYGADGTILSSVGEVGKWCDALKVRRLANFPLTLQISARLKNTIAYAEAFAKYGLLEHSSEFLARDDASLTVDLNDPRHVDYVASIVWDGHDFDKRRLPLSVLDAAAPSGYKAAKPDLPQAKKTSVAPLLQPHSAARLVCIETQPFVDNPLCLVKRVCVLDGLEISANSCASEWLVEEHLDVIRRFPERAQQLAREVAKAVVLAPQVKAPELNLMALELPAMPYLPTNDIRCLSFCSPIWTDQLEVVLVEGEWKVKPESNAIAVNMALSGRLRAALVAKPVTPNWQLGLDLAA
jgi:hypothetical protein